MTDISNPTNGRPPANGIGLAVLGGPLMETDYTFFNLIEQAGGRVVLDATEGGERTLPRRFDPEKLSSDPLRELSEAYFDCIPDAFRRPNAGFTIGWVGSWPPAKSAGSSSAAAFGATCGTPSCIA